ncbi:MAG: MFS transporter [Propionibacteriales bacterium]|nr:MFS transporter [Propionibacteriales bacterium]
MSDTTGRPPGLSRVLSNPGFRRLWTARTISQCGDVAQFVTVSLLVLRLTGSGLGVSGVVVAEIAPVLLLAPLAGPVVDRLSRVRVMISSDIARLVLAGVLVGWHDNVVVVYAVAFGLSAGTVFFSPAANSLLPTLVEEDELVAANSGIWSAAVLSQVVLAPVAGLLAATAGFGWAFALNAASYAVSAVLLRGLRTREYAPPVTSATIWEQGWEALSLLRSDRLLRALGLAQALAALSAGATSALLVVLATRRFGQDGRGYGAMIAAIGLGAVLGPLILSRFSDRVSGPRVIFGAFGLRGIVDLLLGTVTTLPAALGSLTLYGLGTSTGNVSFSSLIQSHVQPAIRGRVFSAFDLIWQSMRLVSLLAGGLLADILGIRAVFYTGGALLILAALAGTTASAAEPRRDP